MGQTWKEPEKRENKREIFKINDHQLGKMIVRISSHLSSRGRQEVFIINNISYYAAPPLNDLQEMLIQIFTEKNVFRPN